MNAARGTENMVHQGVAPFHLKLIGPGPELLELVPEYPRFGNSNPETPTLKLLDPLKLPDRSEFRPLYQYCPETPVHPLQPDAEQNRAGSKWQNGTGVPDNW